MGVEVGVVRFQEMTIRDTRVEYEGDSHQARMKFCRVGLVPLTLRHIETLKQRWLTTYPWISDVRWLGIDLMTVSADLVMLKKAMKHGPPGTPVGRTWYIGLAREVAEHLAYSAGR